MVVQDMVYATSDMGDVTANDIATALRVLRCAAPYSDCAHAASLRAQLLPATKPLLRWEKQVRRAASGGLATTVDCAPAERLAAAVGCAPVELAPDAVCVNAKHYSRLLYPNPVCFLTTWSPVCSVNVMTISWLTPIDNDGHFICSVNQRRHTARVLAAQPIFTLSVAVSGHEALLRKVGSCSGAQVHKPSTCGLDMCTAGWTSPVQPGRYVSDGCDGGVGWPPDRDTAVPRPSELEIDGRASVAPAVAGAAAHLVALVTHVRSEHGHFVCSCEVLRAYVRQEHWSGKTLCPAREGPRVGKSFLSFFGSQIFGHVIAPVEEQSSGRS